MLDELKQRLVEVTTIQARALPRAADVIVSKLRSDVKGAKRRGQRRRKALRAELRERGLTPAQVRTRVRMPRHGSGISIDAVAKGDTVTVTASSVVQMLARRNGEPAEWMDLFQAAVDAAAVKGAR